MSDNEGFLIASSSWLQRLQVSNEEWESIFMDFITTSPLSSKGNAQILVVLDRFSKMAHFIPCKKATLALDVASLFVQHIAWIVEDHHL